MTQTLDFVAPKTHRNCRSRSVPFLLFVVKNTGPTVSVWQRGGVSPLLPGNSDHHQLTVLAPEPPQLWRRGPGHIC